MSNLLLISGSKYLDTGMLYHANWEIYNFLKSKDVKKVLFIPYANPDGMGYNKYTEVIRGAFKKIGFELDSIHELENPKHELQEYDAIFVGGGNTFELLNTLYQKDLIGKIKKVVNENGMPYIGSSAGTNLATLNIKTTNDMPIVHPPSLNALDLVPFNINPHYIERDPSSKHRGETRMGRIKEFLNKNQDATVLAMKEGSILRKEGDNLKLVGLTSVLLMNHNQDPVQYKHGADLSFLLK